MLTELTIRLISEGLWEVSKANTSYIIHIIDDKNYVLTCKKYINELSEFVEIYMSTFYNFEDCCFYILTMN